MPQPILIPDDTLRLFGHYDQSARLLEAAPDFVIGRVLEDGDSRDLNWLFNHFGAGEISDWLERYGSRQLSRRNRSFWSLILEQPVPDPPAIHDQLWPL